MVVYLATAKKMSEEYNFVCEIPTTFLLFGIRGVLKSAEKIARPRNLY